MAVVWHHSAGIYPFDIAFFRHGYLGVDTFFVLSGFLITFLLLKEKTLAGTISLKKFYIRRFLRIFPLYYTYLGLLTLWLIVSDPQKMSEILHSFLYYFFYISNYIPEQTPEQYFHRSWSLAVEEQFYLIWPILFLALTAFRSLFTAAFLILLITFLDIFSISPKVDSFVNLLIPFRAILCGCLLAILLSKPRIYRIFSHLLSSRYAILITSIMLFAVIAYSGRQIAGLEFFIVHLLMMMLVACAVINESNCLSRILSWRPIQLCGVISYGMYILHSQFWGITENIVHFIPVQVIAESKVTFFVVFLFISFFIALLSYSFFEKYFLNLKRKYGY